MEENKDSKNVKLITVTIIVVGVLVFIGIVVGTILIVRNNIEQSEKCENDIFWSSLSVDAKPVIYLYPEQPEEIEVKVGYPEKFTCVYPKYNDGWKVVANPDGTLKDEKTGREYYSLYYECENTKKYDGKLEEGFVIKKENIVSFLEEKLEILGLNEREAEEFIIYWLPQLEANNYIYVRFQTMEEIEDNMPLYINKTPDTLIRIMMEWKGLDDYTEIKEQKLIKQERKGFTVVEWGGTILK